MIDPFTLSLSHTHSLTRPHQKQQQQHSTIQYNTLGRKKEKSQTQSIDSPLVAHPNFLTDQGEAGGRNRVPRWFGLVWFGLVALLYSPMGWRDEMNR